MEVLHACHGCSKMKGLGKPTNRLMHTRADKKLAGVFVDLEGTKPGETRGGRRYTFDNSRRFSPGIFACTSSPTRVRLGRVLHGLKHAGRQWNSRAVDELVDYGMEQRKTAPYVFGNTAVEKVFLILSVHVEDIVAAGKKGDYDDFFHAPAKHVPMTNQGEFT